MLEVGSGERHWVEREDLRLSSCGQINTYLVKCFPIFFFLGGGVSNFFMLSF